MIAVCGLLAVAANAQKGNESADALLVAPSGLKLLAQNISYRGEECSPSDEAEKMYSDDSAEAIKVGRDLYYEGHRFWSSGRGEGLVKENIDAKTCRVFHLSGLEAAAGWRNAKKNERVPDSTNGLFRVGQALWMGSNGIGIAVYDLKQQTWSRFDFKSSVVAGDHLIINYADDDYVFVTRGEFPGAFVHVYSVRKNKWLSLKAVSTKLFREYGSETGMVQVPVDHRIYSKAKYVPLDWTFMGLTAKLVDGGETYLFEKKFSNSKTVFEISKSRLERLF